MAAVQNHVVLAGFSWTTHHQGQQENWFDVWREKAEAAAYTVVVFCKGYRGRFTPALKQEADCIQRLHGPGGQGTPVYVFNSEGERGHSAAEVESNLRQGAKHMGNYGEWESFVNTVPPRDAAEAAATPPPPGPPHPDNMAAGAAAAQSEGTEGDPVNTLVNWMEALKIKPPIARGYAEALVEDGFDSIDALETLEEAELIEYGVKKGHARLILKAVSGR